MAESFIGEIRMFAGNFAPLGWAFCDGSLLQIAENDTLFSLLGTTYGGDGVSTFGLPDLRGRVPIHQGSGYVLGQMAGVETVTLTVNQIPSHNHPLLGTTAPGNLSSPQNGILASSPLGNFSADAPSVPMNASAESLDGGNQPHDNLMPHLAVSFIISLFGIYPSP